MLRVDEEVARTKRTGRPFGLLLVEARRDLGENGRPHLLHSLERGFRTADLVSRLGGLRFVVLLIDSDKEGTSAARDRLEQLVGPRNIHVALTVHPDGDTDWLSFLTNVADAGFPQAEPIWTQGRSSRFD